MAQTATFSDHPRESLARRSANWLTRTADSIARSNPHLRRVRWLQARSDAELAALNIQRDEIVHHVFRNVYYR